ncbi:MAG TPA: hypothetical protein VNW52_05910 [Burkholderiaceae bacterium]|jgi:hypothetical protein|nr:hypothetical protein [Burkholderiaceae bacterium]
MNAQLDFLRSTKQANIAPSLITNVIKTDLFHPEEQIEVINPLDITTSEVSVRHLKSRSDIQEIQYLRTEINLELHRTIDPLFSEHEKKEMN